LNYYDSGLGILTKTWLNNAIRLLSVKDFALVYKTIFSSILLSDVLSYIKNPKNTNKKYATIILFTEINKTTTYGLGVHSLRIFLDDIKKWEFNQEQYMGFLPIWLKNNKEIFEVKYYEYKASQSLLLNFIFKRVDQQYWSIFKEYLPEKAFLINPTPEEEIIDLFPDKDKKTTFLRLDRGYISQNYPELLLDNLVIEMIALISKVLHKNADYFNISCCNSFDLYKDKGRSDESFLTLTSKDNTDVKIDKIKVVVQKLIDLYGNEKTKDYAPDFEYLNKACLFVALSENTTKQKENTKRQKL
jgi:hypothetical protein